MGGFRAVTGFLDFCLGLPWVSVGFLGFMLYRVYRVYRFIGFIEFIGFIGFRIQLVGTMLCREGCSLGL